MKNKTRTYIVKGIGVLAGAIGGYLYYHYVGCASGTCPITSNPYVSTFYGALLGFLAADIIKIKPKENE